MYDWLDAKVVGTSSTLSTKHALSNAYIMVSDPSNLLVIQVP